MSNKDLVIFASVISAGLIKSGDYIPCCDEIIIKEDEPSELIMDLSLMTDEGEAVKCLLKEAYDNFEEKYPLPDPGYFEVCAEFMRFQSGKIDWGDFLRSAIDIAEHGPCQWTAYDFRKFLDAYIENDSSEIIAENQSQHMEGVLKEDIEEIGFYIEIVEKRNLTSLSKGHS